MDKKILKLENNKEYFVIGETIQNDINYLLIMNVDSEYDVKIVKKFSVDNEDYIIDLEDKQLVDSLKDTFKKTIDEEKNQFA